jgi:hypothetical protein
VEVPLLALSTLENLNVASRKRLNHKHGITNTITVVFRTVKRDHFFSPTPELLLDLKRLERSEAIERLERLEPAAAVGERSD